MFHEQDQAEAERLANFPYTDHADLVPEFASRGLLVLSPESLRIPLTVHEDVFRQEKAIFAAGQRVTPESVPAILDVLNAPGLIAACNQLVGEDWAIVPFTHNAPFASGPRDQHWHKDDNGPYNSRKQRHHQAVQIEMIYYPQIVYDYMGPTATIPYSHYWTFNHETNHDNFAGADHLDFDYHLSGMERIPVSGPESPYSTEDIVSRNTAHDKRMREAVTNTGWPLVESFEAAPLRAGSIILYSHNTFHRGNHRRDHWQNWPEQPRFMWRFYIYRTTEIKATKRGPVPEFVWGGRDQLTGTDLDGAGDDMKVVWRYHYHWLHCNEAPADRPVADPKAEAARLTRQLYARGTAAEPDRIGAAYQLASIGDKALATRILGEALYNDRESVRRAATYGLIATGKAATLTLLEAARSRQKWVRKAGIYALGDVADLEMALFTSVAACLADDPSVYVRAVAAGTLGCLSRRAIATGIGSTLLTDCVAALLASLGREENRLGMSRAQGRSIKFVRPTDDSDVCEGDGIDFGLDRFEPVRSAVRENVLWSLVIICANGAANLGPRLDATIGMLRHIVATDANVISVGYAMDALARLAYGPAGPPYEATITALRAELPEILATTPIQCWESLVRAGMPFTTIADLMRRKA